MPRSVISRRTLAPPPLLGHIIHAFAGDARDAARATAIDRAATLHDLARLFMIAVPTRGVMDPADDVRDEIERIANRHLRRGRADARFRSAVGRVPNVQERDAIESAHGEVVEISELAHYYAGLAAGITLADLGRGSR
jgi:hypothetical protein